MPSSSTGFCVARTRKGDGSGRVSPASVTCRSCMASRSADCTFAGARLISSARTKFAKTGPSRTLHVAGLRAEDLRADEVGRQQVGRELDAVERAPEARRRPTAPRATSRARARPRAARARRRAARRGARRSGPAGRRSPAPPRGGRRARNALSRAMRAATACDVGHGGGLRCQQVRIGGGRGPHGARVRGGTPAGVSSSRALRARGRGSRARPRASPRGRPSSRSSTGRGASARSRGA